MRLNKLAISTVCLPLMLVGCGVQDPEPSAESEAPNNGDTSLEGFEPRPSDAPILGNVTAEGECDPQVVKMDNEKNTPHIHYEGQPGDELTIKYMNGDEVVQEDSVELSSTTTSIQTGSSTYNGDLDRAEIVAKGRSGTDGTCHITIK
ncbi:MULTISPECIES: hypothetical protein [unclassified Corynebacterium]|uniref:hypothetical protein n=1 Tax=Corynebacterium TaxID=1716 RepID=UPI00254F4388|nr:MULTISPECIES: hypothetical protein [unclassified Corynebacterium]MDK8475737.1 hypothetical protein [Corynebacterium sp. MSK310]MDK8673243.1 hypothetical protein [Corynebacterium sp. MSK189]MDK8736505.1 hypothetical protein [Corynebacterium sp. MSK306]MDK8765460.1 hypothetical protein [Corynebacterium sp. MSK293]